LNPRDPGGAAFPDFPEPETDAQGLSRRDLLKQAGVLGVTVALPSAIVSAEAKAAAEGASLLTFTAAQDATLSAIVERLIPKDENGPGAIEAGVPRYIDRLLQSEKNSFRGPNNPGQNLTDAYAAGLQAVDAYSRETHAAPFEKLSPSDQDAVLSAMQANRATGFTPDSRTFFNLLRQHALEGMFGDPYYGGNANFAGWDLIGYPGIKLAFSEEEQKLDVDIRILHKGATDYRLFTASRKGM
jgi:gluconate 2-dehydrogenase gamma chain